MKKEYIEQARLMLRLLPFVADEECFALKGGTALNFFVWDMPRLSVDINLTYLPVELRDTSLQKISEALLRIEKAIARSFPDFNVHRVKNNDLVLKLVIRAPYTEVKIEPNTVIRGTVFGTEMCDLSEKARKILEVAVNVRVLAKPELFGGKICAALDRQHPRDLFDVKLLLEGLGLTDEIRKGFLLHLISHDRPMHEVINPSRKDVRDIYKSEFAEMTEETVPYDVLVEVRERLILGLKNGLTNDEKYFLLSLKEGKPVGSLLGLNGVERLPAVQWKLRNIQKMSVEKQREQYSKLRAVLGV